MIRPRLRSQNRNKYTSSQGTGYNNEATDKDTYEEIGQQMSASPQNLHEPDYYNIKETSVDNVESTYDKIKVYSNVDNHDYGRIKI